MIEQAERRQAEKLHARLLASHAPTIPFGPYRGCYVEELDEDDLKEMSEWIEQRREGLLRLIAKYDRWDDAIDQQLEDDPPDWVEDFEEIEP
jgi:hypothetical protein